jgi:hypothetical protein
LAVGLHQHLDRMEHGAQQAGTNRLQQLLQHL